MRTTISLDDRISEAVTQRAAAGGGRSVSSSIAAHSAGAEASR